MDKLSEYIPLLIILVSLVVTIAGKKKKPAKITPKTMLPGKTIEELFEEKKVKKTLNDPPRKTVDEKPRQPVFQRQELTPGKEILSYLSDPVVVEPESEESSFSFEEDDAVKAIIYAEIINKKEY